jgi:hypothetical protein
LDDHALWNVVNRTDMSLDFTSSDAPPFPPVGVNVDEFWAIWEGQQFFNASGQYRFVMHVADGCRLFIDDALVLDEWHKVAFGPRLPIDLAFIRRPSPWLFQVTEAEHYLQRVELTRGVHSLRFEFAKFSRRAVIGGTAQVSYVDS